MGFEDILFYVFGAIALASSLVLIGQRSPVYSAFALIVTLGSLSVIYALLGSSFIAVLQIVVYAGAIMVLFLFVLMLLRVQREQGPGSGPALRGAALGLLGLLVLQVGAVLLAAGIRPGEDGFEASNAAAHADSFTASSASGNPAADDGGNEGRSRIRAHDKIARVRWAIA